MIPKIIHQLWKTNSIPSGFTGFVSKLKQLHPTWEYKLWTDEMLATFIQSVYPEFVARYNAYPHHIQRVDAARYLILNSIGGVYIDLDIELVSAIDDLLTAKSVFATEHPIDANRMGVKVLVSNAFMATAPNTKTFHNITHQLIQDHPHPYSDKRMAVLHSTGPMFLTNRVGHEDVLLLPSNTFFSKSLTGVYQHASDPVYGVHHFASTWW